MIWQRWLLWGFVATVVLTTLMAAAQRAGLTRMSMPYVLGTMLTPDRNRARVYGVLLHMLNGWVFALLYIGAIHAAQLPTWWFGAAVGIVHALFVLVVILPAMPGMHPRMASEIHGPTVVKQLEPPGFLGLNYGVRTPLSVLFAHVVYGSIVGGFYGIA